MSHTHYQKIKHCNFLEVASNLHDMEDGMSAWCTTGPVIRKRGCWRPRKCAMPIRCYCRYL